MRKNRYLLAAGFLVLTGVCAEAAGEYVYDSQGKRNPFIPLVTSDGRLVKLADELPKNVSLALEGIIYDKNGNSYALISGEVVKVGDAVGPYQVLRIEKDKVMFVKDGQVSEVLLKKEEE